MKSYVRIYGPPLLKAIRALEKVAVGMPQVCIMDTMIESNMPSMAKPEGVENYFSAVGGVPKERCDKIISKSGDRLGDMDFYFEWFRKPGDVEVNQLIERIDEALAPLGVKYTITTK
jgi:hypothetical protein